MRFSLNALPQDTFDKLLTEMRSQGTAVGDPSIAPGNGMQYLIEGPTPLGTVKAAVLYYAGAQMATVVILDKPWLVSNATIEQRVRDAVAVARG